MYDAEKAFFHCSFPLCATVNWGWCQLTWDHSALRAPCWSWRISFRSSVLRLFRAFALLRPNPRLLAMLPCWTFSLELSPTDCASGIRLLSVSPLRLRKRLRISCSLAQALTLFEIVVNLSDAIIILLGYIRPTPMFPRWDAAVIHGLWNFSKFSAQNYGSNWLSFCGVEATLYCIVLYLYIYIALLACTPIRSASSARVPESRKQYSSIHSFIHCRHLYSASSSMYMQPGPWLHQANFIIKTVIILLAMEGRGKRKQESKQN